MNESKQNLASPSLTNNFIPEMPSLPWPIILPTLAITYVCLVRLLRFRALRQIESKYAAFLSNPYKLSYKQAQEILQLPLLHDMPFLFLFGTQWALIKSYGIASGTPLLVKTRQLVDASKVGKRAEDTAVFIGEFLAGDLDSERGRLAMAKLNWMHHRYDIKEGDYVHSLALFVLEPQRWIERYEWRPLTRLEKVAHFVYWREIGHRMGFGGIPETLEELERWRGEYERTHLYFIEENRIVTDATVEVFLRQTPKFLHSFMRALFVSFIEDKKVREALGYPDPPTWATLLTTSFFRLRGWLIRHFFLPRRKYMDILAKPGADGRLYRNPKYVAFEPWYVADTWYNRWFLWIKFGGTITPGKRFKSHGYTPEELGPVGLETAAAESIWRQAQAMEEYVKMGGSSGSVCSFNFGW